MLNRDVRVNLIKDFEMDPVSRRARIIMQTCAHVSGAAYYYDPKKLNIHASQSITQSACKKVNTISLLDIFFHSSFLISFYVYAYNSRT